MIRRFILGLMALVFAVGCGYYWWQTTQLTSQVSELRVKLAAADAQIKKLHRSTNGRAGKAVAAGRNAALAPISGPTDWLAEGNVHFEKARAALEDRDFGIAQRESKAATDDYQRAAAKPLQATQNGLAAARQNIADLEAKMKSAVSQ